MEFPADVPTLTDGDVTLRAHRTDDIEAIVEQCTDPVSVEWTTVPHGYTAEMARSFVTDAIPKMWETETEWIFAIEATHTDGRRRFGGSLSLRDEGSRRAEVAFGAHPGVRGRGVMTTAVNLLLDWGFSALDLETVLWLANRGNAASRRVAWKTGFTFGGTLPGWLDHRGEHLDAWTATLHRDDPRSPTHTWYDVPVIPGSSVVLRPQRPDDADRIAEGCADERTQYWLAFLPSPYTQQDALAYIERGVEAAASGQHIQWAVADAETDQLIGVVGLPRMQRESAEVGYWAHPDGRGRGATTEAVALLTRHAFADAGRGGLDLRRLFIKAAEDNVGSQQVALKNGFVRIGTERRSERLGDGSYADIAVFDLLRDEWKDPIGEVPG
ncbi:MAG: GNAT family N-acetyltransferase [Nocardioidaceae bacterium]